VAIRREVYDAERRVVLTHSHTLHTAQSRGFDQTLAKATAKLSALGDTLARGHTHRPRAKVNAEIAKILHDPWAARVISYQLTGDTPPQHRLSFQLDQAEACSPACWPCNSPTSCGATPRTTD